MPMTLVCGTKLGPYEIQSPLGAGGMGEVYRAFDTRLERNVAIKILPEYFAKDNERLERFKRESRATAALNHPNILAIYDIGDHRGNPYVVCELLEGETLRDRLRTGPLAARKAIHYGQQIARGLAAAHEKGIVHRDLKPENIFLTADGRAKILDFGLAKFTHSESDRSGDAPTMQVATEAGTLLGTVGYMAPEQVRGKPADPRSDIFTKCSRASVPSTAIPLPIQ
jgi:eukaryotic-like serine/threonine-protein kinase